MFYSIIVTHWSVLDIDDKLNVVFDLFPKSSPQQNQIKSMVIVKAKCKSKKSAPPRREGSLYIHGSVPTVPIYMGTCWGPSIHMCY